jgi:hypothetical protein
MTSLLDIGPLTEEVSVNGKRVTVYGVTPEGFFYLLEKFPMLRSMFGGGVKGVTMDMLREVAPTSIAYALAVATTDRSRYPTAPEWIAAVDATVKVAMNLSAHFQMALFQAALRLTFPDGIGPFMRGVETLADSINRVSGQAPATISSKQSRSGFVTDSPGMRLGRGAPSASSVH